MDDRDLQPFNDESPATGGGLSGRHIAIIGVVALAVLAAVVWFTTRAPGPEPEQAQPRRVETVPEGTRNVTLYFADSEEPGKEPDDGANSQIGRPPGHRTHPSR